LVKKLKISCFIEKHVNCLFYPFCPVWTTFGLPRPKSRKSAPNRSKRTPTGGYLGRGFGVPESRVRAQIRRTWPGPRFGSHKASRDLQFDPPDPQVDPPGRGPGSDPGSWTRSWVPTWWPWGSELRKGPKVGGVGVTYMRWMSIYVRLHH